MNVGIEKIYEDFMIPKEWEFAINTLTFAFQPIIDIKAKRIYGFEALLREYKKAGFHQIYDIFDLAFKQKVLYSLDLIFREKLLSLFVKLPEYQQRRILYNIDNRILEMPDFESGNTQRILRKYNLPNSSFIFEISERLPFASYEYLSKIIYNYHSQGFKIAIDDFGVGYSSLQLIYTTEPDIIKLDRFFIYNIHQDLRKKLFVEQIVKITHLLGGIVIAEGIEIFEELLTCIEVGIDLVQGYYISEPFYVYEYDTKIKRVKEILNDLQKNFYSYITQKENDNIILELEMQNIPPIKYTLKFEEILNHFSLYPKYDIFPVVNEFDEPIGIIKEKEFKKFFISPYTRELLKYKDFSQLLKEHIVKTHIIEANTDIQNFFELISKEEFLNDNFFREIIVSERGKYKGIIFSENILKYVFKKKLIVGKESNPLTNLPGNKSIRKFILENQKFLGTLAMVYLDINQFKPFNDIYGFENGDKLILYISSLLKGIQIDKNDFFIGHIGGDDFIIFLKNKSLYLILKYILSIQKKFNEYIKTIIHQNNLEKNYFIAKNRFEVEQKFSFPSISAGILFSVKGELPIEQLSILMAEVKNLSKKSKKGIYYKIL